MEADIAQRLIDLNRRFYQNFAEAFSDTRGRLQPGVLKVLDDFPARLDILDLGCGNGTLAAELARRGHQVRYVGLDFSEGLLEIARQSVPEALDADFQQADLTAPDWSRPLGDQRFDYVLAFAFLHHLPGEEVRLRLLRQVRELLRPGGRFIHSNWQFLNSERLRERIQSWESVGILDEEVEEWDYLLDWRRDGEGLRYVHYFTEEQLTDLAGKSDFKVKESFYSDGQTGDLGLYQVWTQAP